MAWLGVVDCGRPRRNRYGKLVQYRHRIVKRGDIILTGANVTRGDAHAKLQPQQAAILAALMINESYLAGDKLIEYVWPEPGSEPDFARDHLAKQITALRRHVRPLGLKISVYPTRGWVLE